MFYVLHGLSKQIYILYLKIQIEYSNVNKLQEQLTEEIFILLKEEKLNNLVSWKNSIGLMHLRYMITGRPATSVTFRAFSFL